ncbi:DUF4312 family protein [Spiroplasma sp. SV19]|uniref:DUF4312 family protein n=1 Tax=Spiroplasma sp. SV19 TaxID=2570468 RepID=UPI0024B7E1DC|nr:DUF4312 family protein [Spiroplasma sp. SV19]WHQ37447.1 DUF4312 family protein [Spiroplasma sp. SV19]
MNKIMKINVEKQHLNVEHNEQSILKIEEAEIIVMGKGNNMREAYNAAFDEMKKAAYKKFNNFIIHLEPLNVISIADDTYLNSKRLLGVFLPYKKIKYQLKLKIIVRAKYIEIV